MFQGTCFGDWNGLPFSFLSSVPLSLHMATFCHIHGVYSRGLFCYHAIWLDDSDKAGMYLLNTDLGTGDTAWTMVWRQPVPS